MTYLKLLRQSQNRRRDSSLREEGKRDLPEIRCKETEGSQKVTVEGADAKKLTEAGYKPKVSFGDRIIWERPDTGFYVSKEMALHLLDAKHVRDKSGADTRR